MTSINVILANFEFRDLKIMLDFCRHLRRNLLKGLKYCLIVNKWVYFDIVNKMPTKTHFFLFLVKTTHFDKNCVLEIVFWWRSVNFKTSFWCHRLDQNTNAIFLRISALATKKRLNKKKIKTLYTANWRNLFWLSYTTFLIWPLFRG